MSKVKFDTLMLDISGQTIAEKDGPPLTLGRMALVALDSVLDTDKGEALEVKLERGKLVDKIGVSIQANKPITLSTKELNFLKNRIGQVFASANLVYKACLLLV